MDSRSLPRISIRIGLVLLVFCGLIALSRPIVAQARLEAGTLLVASRGLKDPNFRETVVLIFDHGDHGAGGVIVNRPTAVPLREAFPSKESLEFRKDVLWEGGPVMPRSLTAIVRSQVENKGDSLTIMDDIQMIDPNEALERVERFSLAADQLRIFAGHAGWIPGQLEAEIARGGWELIPGRPDWIFLEEPESLWETLIKLAVLPTT